MHKMMAVVASIAISSPAIAFAQTQPTETQPQPTQPEPQPPPPQVTVRTIVEPPAKRHFAELVSLRVMHEKHIITDAEYQSAVDEIGASIGPERARDGLSLLVGNFSATLYGFVESDFIVDSTQSFADVAGNGLVARSPGSPQPLTGNVSQYAGGNARTQFGIRNSRFGLRIRAPETHGIRASGTLEMDFLGFDPSPPAGNTDAAFFNNPTLRVRHAYLKLETPIVDVLVGQYWHMFGWQPAYFPTSVEIQGLPGELYERTAQLRLSHKFASKHASLEIAAAAMRPPARDNAIPDLAAGLRFSAESWRGMQTTGATSTSLAPASIAVTGDLRNFKVPEFAALPVQSVSLPTAAIAVDAFLPIIPANEHRHGNALSISGEFAYGGGISDMYSSLTGGITFPSLVNTTGVNPAPTYPQNVDNGMVILDNLTHDLHAIIWMTTIAGIQYYFPGVDGKLWVAANYAHTESPNIDQFTNSAAASPLNSNYAQAAGVRKSEDWGDFNLFVEPLPGVRFGAEFAVFLDHYVDIDPMTNSHVTATNYRGQLSAFFLF